MQAYELLQAVNSSDEHGFNPARYGLQPLPKQLAALQTQADRRGAPLDVSSQAASAASRSLDRAFRLLLRDLDRGLVDPSETQYRVFTRPANHDIEQIYGQVQQGELSIGQALAAVTPAHWHYAKLRASLRQLLDRRQREGSVTAGRSNGIPSVDAAALQPGARDPAIMSIKRRLIHAGVLPETTVLTPRFDAALLVALKAFQAQNGLPETGEIDNATLEALALGDDETIARIVQSLERWRWMPDDLGKRYLLVNLPNYRVEFFNGTQRIIDMPVVIGKASRGTPVFSRDMEYIEFSPTWTVPSRIAERELLPIERRSPGYLASRGFRLMRIDAGRLIEVPDSQMNPQTFAQQPLPYLLQQKAGANNALGRMKFMLPNPYAIYLHDTPARHLFGKPTRAFSHGCIRLEDPDRLASLLLQIDGRTLDEIDVMLAGTETHKVNLRTAVPTHLAYFTTWIDAAGRLQHRPDVYRLDAPLRDALMNSDSLLNHLHGNSRT